VPSKKVTQKKLAKPWSEFLATRTPNCLKKMLAPLGGMLG
jgi:hypothetical protein